MQNHIQYYKSQFGGKKKCIVALRMDEQKMVYFENMESGVTPKKKVKQRRPPSKYPRTISIDYVLVI